MKAPLKILVVDIGRKERRRFPSGKLTRPMGCRMGDSAKAFLGGFQLREEDTK